MLIQVMPTIAQSIRSRVYAVTEASKYVLIVSGVLATSSLTTGLWFVSMPSAKGNTRTPTAVILV